MPLAARIAIEIIIIAAIVLTIIYAYLAARRRERERERLGLLPPDEQLAHFDELLREHEQMKGPKRWQ